MLNVAISASRPCRLPFATLLASADRSVSSAGCNAASDGDPQSSLTSRPAARVPASADHSVASDAVLVHRALSHLGSQPQSQQPVALLPADGEAWVQQEVQHVSTRSETLLDEHLAACGCKGVQHDRTQLKQQTVAALLRVAATGITGQSRHNQGDEPVVLIVALASINLGDRG